MCSQNRLKNGIMLIGKIVPLRLKAAFIEECLTFLCKWKTKCFSPPGSEGENITEPSMQTQFDCFALVERLF